MHISVEHTESHILLWMWSRSHFFHFFHFTTRTCSCSRTLTHSTYFWLGQGTKDFNSHLANRALSLFDSFLSICILFFAFTFIIYGELSYHFRDSQILPPLFFTLNSKIFSSDLILSISTTHRSYFSSQTFFNSSPSGSLAFFELFCRFRNSQISTPFFLALTLISS